MLPGMATISCVKYTEQTFLLKTYFYAQNISSAAHNRIKHHHIPCGGKVDYSEKFK